MRTRIDPSARSCATTRARWIFFEDQFPPELALPTPVDVPATPYAAMEELSDPVVEPLVAVEPEDEDDPILLPDDDVAPPAPPLPVVSSHAASCATPTARPRDTATAARRTFFGSETAFTAPARGASQCGHASSVARTWQAQSGQATRLGRSISSKLAARARAGQRRRPRGATLVGPA